MHYTRQILARPTLRRLGFLFLTLLPAGMLLFLLTTAQAERRVGTGPAPAGLSAAEWRKITAHIQQAEPARVAPPSLTTANFTPTGRLQAYDYKDGDQFGWSVALSGDTLVVGAPYEDDGYDQPVPDTGAAYIFERAADGQWIPEDKLLAGDRTPGYLFGSAVAIDGDTIVVGAYGRDGNGGTIEYAGAAYVFARDAGGAENWGQVAQLTAGDMQENDYFGWAVAVYSDTVLVGAPQLGAGYGNGVDSGPGKAYLFARDSGGPNNWGQVTKLTPGDNDFNHQFGWAVTLAGDTAAVGAPYYEFGQPAGQVGSTFVFERDAGGAGNWGQAAQLTAGDGQPGDWFGAALTSYADTIVVGATGMDGNDGAAYVYDRDQSGPGTWGEVTRVANGSQGAFGLRLALSADTLVVADGAETLFFYERDTGGPNAWGLVDQVVNPDGPAAGDAFGRALALDGNTIAVGAQLADEDVLNDIGAVHTFDRVILAPEESAILTSDYPTEDTDFGSWGISVSGDLIAIGSPIESTAGGAVYIFERNLGGDNNWGQLIRLEGQAGDFYGSDVALEGDTLVVGASSMDGGVSGTISNAGIVIIYQRDRGGPENWGEVTRLYASDAQANDGFGADVEISGDTIAVAAEEEDGGPGDPLPNAGAIYVFDRNQSNPDEWLEVVKVMVSDPHSGDRLGSQFNPIALDRDTLIIGLAQQEFVPHGPLYQSGAAYVFARDHGGANNWGEVKKLTAFDAQIWDQFGYVAIDGDTIAVGAINEDIFDGAIYLYQRDLGGPDNWGLRRKIRGELVHPGKLFVFPGLIGDMLVVGAPGDSPDADKGSMYILHRSQGGPENWGKVNRVFPSGAQNNEYFSLFGFPVAVDGSTILGATPYEDDGVVYVFDPPNDTLNAVAGNAYFVAEGGSVLLDGSASSDPTDPPSALTYEWDLDFDGFNFDVDATGITTTFAAANIDGPSTRIIALRVTNTLAQSDVDNTGISIVNVPPAVDAGPDQNAELTVPLTFSGTFTDPGIADTYSIIWDFGDGSVITGTLTPTYTFMTTGTYTVTLTVVDDDGGSGMDTLSVTVLQTEFFAHLPLAIKEP